MKGMIGKKLGMTRFFIEDAQSVAVTVIQTGPCTVVQKKTKDKDGYDALQLGFGVRKPKLVNRPQAGHLRASGGQGFAILKEFKTDKVGEFEVGQEVTLDLFEVGDKVNVTGTTKGRGFAGVMKRHGFAGGSASHGCTTPRSPGSISASAYPSRVFPGKRMPGHFGTERQTVVGLEVVEVRPEYGVILVKGAVPGPRNGIVLINKRFGS